MRRWCITRKQARQQLKGCCCALMILLTDIQVGGVVGEAPARVRGAVNEQNVGRLIPGVCIRLEAGAAWGRIERAQLGHEAAADAAAARSPASSAAVSMLSDTWRSHGGYAQVTWLAGAAEGRRPGFAKRTLETMLARCCILLH